MSNGLKIAIAGKGGVGKTTFAAALILSFNKKGQEVLAIDADPDANLAAALGFPPDVKITPLVEMKDLIEERTGARPGSKAVLFKLNPHLEDIPGKYAFSHNGIKLLVMGGLHKGGSGCYCPENVFLKRLTGHLLLRDGELVILDMEAGIEHLTRGTAEVVDRLLVVVEPSKASLETARRIKKLAQDIGVKKISLVANKVRGEADARFLTDGIKTLSFLGFLPFDEQIMEQERSGFARSGFSGPFQKELEKIIQKI